MEASTPDNNIVIQCSNAFPERMNLQRSGDMKAHSAQRSGTFSYLLLTDETSRMLELSLGPGLDVNASIRCKVFLSGPTSVVVLLLAKI